MITDVLHYAPAPGDANRLTVGDVDDRDLVVRDAAAPLQPGAGCAQGAGGVVCAVEAGARRSLRIDGEARERGGYTVWLRRSAPGACAARA